MDIQLQINGESYTGQAYQANGSLVICLPGVQSAHAPVFDDLFQPLPDETASGGFVEVGEWNGRAFQFETQVSFRLGPDGKVWAQVCDLSELQAVGSSLSTRTLAFQMLDEAEEAFGAKRLANERAACERVDTPITVEEYMTLLEAEAVALQEQADRNPRDREQARLARALAGLCSELRGLGFEPTPTEWQNANVDIEPDEGPLVEAYENASRVHDDDWLEAMYEDRGSGLEEE